jgi:hypothetical protein
MASAPSDPRHVVGRVDSAGRLVAADRELERMQIDAGARLGDPVALPQLAAIARTARQLNVPIARRAVAASRDKDIDMWVRAVPEGEEVILSIEQWHARPVSGPRLVPLSHEPEPLLPDEVRRWKVDEQLRLTHVSHGLAALAGLDASTTGQPLTAIFRLEPSEDGSMPLLAGLAARSPFTGQKVVYGGDKRQLLLSGDPLFGADGEFHGFEGAADFPGETRPPAPKGEPDTHVQDLLRTPLDQIIESAGRIADRSEGPLRNEYAIYAADISAAAHHLLSVLRAMNQIGAAQPSRVDLAEVTQEAVGLVESAALERDIAVAIEPVESCRANGEPRGVMQILVNLIGNAIRHSPAQSAVSISFERRNGTAIVHVADNGPGIAAADQDRIFERFEQGAEAGQGSGLGLAIARRLARGMGGEIKLESNPGEGSTFSLLLPTG